jgi:putative flippase GtrA
MIPAIKLFLEVIKGKGMLKIFRFMIVGALNTITHLVVFWFYVQFVNDNKFFANITAYILSSLISFCINTIWTFDREIRAVILLRFQLVSIFGLLISGFVGYVAQIYLWSIFFTVLVTALVVPVVSFFLHKRITYK